MKHLKWEMHKSGQQKGTPTMTLLRFLGRCRVLLLVLVLPLVLATGVFATPEEEHDLIQQVYVQFDVLNSEASKEDKIAAFSKLKVVRDKIRQLAAKDPKFSSREEAEDFRTMHDSIDEYMAQEARKLDIYLNADPPKEVKKVLPGGKIKVSLDGKEKECKIPVDFIPWPVPEQWARDARFMRNREFMIRLRILENSPSHWARDNRKKIERRNVDEMKSWLHKFIKSMYVELHGGMKWEDLVKTKKKVGLFEPGHLFKKDAERITRQWAEGGIKEELIRKIFDSGNMGEKKSRPASWHWLESHFNIVDVRREYEGAQQDLRRHLLIEDDWDLKKAKDWKGGIDRYRNIIIQSEKKLMWLLGYSDPRKLKRLENAEAFKEKDLGDTQKALLKSYLIKKWFEATDGKNQLMGAGSTPADRKKMTADKKRSKEFKEKYKKLYDDSNKKLEKIRTTVDAAGKHGIMRNGIDRAFKKKEGLLELHLIDKNDDFYKEIFGDKEYKRLEDRFPVFKQLSVYRQFLHKWEFENFDEQEKLRSKNRRQIR